MKLLVSTVGEVPRSFVEFVRRVLEHFYTSLRGVEVPELVEIYIYGSKLDKLLFIEEEARSLGIAAVGDFVTMHEAWRGRPRIHISYEECCSLDRDLLEALLLHEAV